MELNNDLQAPHNMFSADCYIPTSNTGNEVRVEIARSNTTPAQATSDNAGTGRSVVTASPTDLHKEHLGLRHSSPTMNSVRSYRPNKSSVNNSEMPGDTAATGPFSLDPELAELRQKLNTAVAKAHSSRKGIESHQLEIESWISLSKSIERGLKSAAEVGETLKKEQSVLTAQKRENKDITARLKIEVQDIQNNIDLANAHRKGSMDMHDKARQEIQDVQREIAQLESKLAGAAASKRSIHATPSPQRLKRKLSLGSDSETKPQTKTKMKLEANAEVEREIKKESKSEEFGETKIKIEDDS